MYVTLIVSLLILSHVLTDFYFQTDELVKKKSQSWLWVLKRSIHFFISALLLTILFFNLYLLVVLGIITIIHFLIDAVKIHFNKSESYLKSLKYFITDQLIHIFFIVAAYPFLYGIDPNIFLSGVLEKLLFNYPFLELINDINLLSYTILVIAGLLFSIKGGTILSLLIIKLPQEKQKKQSEGEIQDKELEGRIRYGKIIGNIERIIIIYSILTNQFNLIAIIVAIKSIGRFKELGDKTSDYYIIGNFASLLIAFFIGTVLIFARNLLLT